MKKIICSAAILLAVTSLITIPANAGNRPVSEKKKETRKEKRKERRDNSFHPVNPVTEAQFYDDFPDAKEINWSYAEFSEASFLDNGIKKIAYYDSDNMLVGTTTIVMTSDLPVKAQEYIKNKYPGYGIKEVIYFDDNEDNDTDMIVFNQSFEDRDNYFPVITNGTKTIILKVSTEGDVSFFKNYK